MILDYLEKVMREKPDGLITYFEYMEAALYHPVYGYYMNEVEKIGRGGDFITTSNVSDIFGRTIAKWAARLMEAMGIGPAFCEIGGGNGRFAKAFLEEWERNSSMPLTYIIAETSPYHRKLQSEALGGFRGFRQVDSIEEIKDFKGIVFSNELFDALPVHVIKKMDGRLWEVMIGKRGDKLYEKLVALDNEEILQFIKESGLNLQEQQRIEIPLLMDKLIGNISKALTEGLVVTIDYGYTNEEWLEPGRKAGSLRGYMKHKMYNDVLEHPGSMDITTHIHFDRLISAGEKCGLQTIAKLRQDEFLVSAGILKELEENYDPNPFSEKSKRNRAIRSLVLPSGMSSAFHVVVHKKGTGMCSGNLFK